MRMPVDVSGAPAAAPAGPEQGQLFPAAESAAGSGSPPPSPAAPSDSAAATNLPPGGASASPAAATPPPGAAPDTPSPWAPVEDMVRRYAPHLAAQHDGGEALVTALLLSERRAREAARLEPYAQQYAQHADRFHAWLRDEEAKRQAQAQGKPASWWNAPEYDPNWRNAVYQDPQSGEWRVRPGHPPDTIQKLTSALQHQQQFLDKFAFDPVGSIRPGLEEVVREVAGQMFSQGLGREREQGAAQAFVSQNASWLYQKDPLTGQQQLSDMGRSFYRHVEEAERLGLSGYEAQLRYALKSTQLDYAAAELSRLKGGPAAAPNGAAAPANGQLKQQFLDRASQNGAAAPAARQPSQAEPPPPRRSGDHSREIQRRMLQKAQQEGLVGAGARVPG